MTKSANEEPGGVLRKRNRSNCVQPDDLRNSRHIHALVLSSIMQYHNNSLMYSGGPRVIES
eukprot:931469-Pyramimonas_sp.AAC.1